MNSLTFYKYEGTGNDFIMIHDPDKRLQRNLSKNLIASWCHRRTGIGADGLILIQPEVDYDFRMVYYNADGQESTMCGNGGRCAVHFGWRLGIGGEKISFVAIDGPHGASIEGNQVHLSMIDVKQINDVGLGMLELNTGSPHLIVWAEEVVRLDVFNKGRKLRNSEPFLKHGINVNFAEITGPGELMLRTYERGVEGETLSCGTGVTAAALASAFAKGFSSPVKITTPGGELNVSFEKDDNHFFNIVLSGAVREVFSGQIMTDWQP